MRPRLFTGEVAEGCQVVANASPSMGVRVQAGTMRIPSGTAPANFWYEAAIDTASPGEALTVPTANASNPRRDLVVAYIDKAVTPTTSVTNNSNNVLKLAVVPGTPASTPSDPTSSQITTAIGASNPYIILARITVGAGVTQITNNDISSLRKMMTITTPMTPSIAVSTTPLVITAGAAAVALLSLPVTVPNDARYFGITASIPDITCGGAAIGVFKLLEGGAVLQTVRKKFQDVGDVNYIDFTCPTFQGSGNRVFTLTAECSGNNIQLNLSNTSIAILSVGTA